MLQPKLNGLILVGGKSARMKSPKAYLDFGAGPQWQACTAAMSHVCEHIFYSVSPHLDPPLRDVENIIEDVFAEPIGPLGGIISAFKRNSSCAFFIVACDMPNFGVEAVNYLFAQRDSQKKATVFYHNNLLEPLAGIYEPTIFFDLVHYWAQDRYCPRAILSTLDIKRVVPPDERWLININHQHEYAMVNEQNHKTITVHYYASLREEAQRSQEKISTAMHSVGDLFAELKKQYGFLISAEMIRFAVNDRLVPKDTMLNHNDSVVFIPPVSGG